MPSQRNSDGALIQLRAYLAQHDPPASTRLPPERQLSEMLGLSRNELRKALAVLENEGQLWRHVGKGTFIGSRPSEPFPTLSDIKQRTHPAEVMRTRLLLEPPIAREAAMYATPAEVEAMRQCAAQSRLAQTWRQYENCDNQLHWLIATATQNRLLTSLFDTLNAVRRTVVWGRRRVDPVKPPPDHHSFEEHDAIVAAIANRDLEGAEQAMLSHLRSVERYLIEWRDGAQSVGEAFTARG